MTSGYGYTDLLVGAYGEDSGGGNEAGAAYIVLAGTY